MIDQKTLRLVVIILLSATVFMCCKDDNPTEPNYNTALVGSWSISAMNWCNQGKEGNYNQAQLDSIGIIWNLTLRSDKTGEQTSNYCCALSTHTGTWSATEYDLTLKLKDLNSDEVVTTAYRFVIDGNKLVLDWRSTVCTIYYFEFTKQ